jgi:hypothetical protein
VLQHRSRLHVVNQHWLATISSAKGFRVFLSPDQYIVNNYRHNNHMHAEPPSASFFEFRPFRRRPGDVERYF